MRNSPVFIIAGHNQFAQGAMGYDGVSEHTRTVDLQQRVAGHSYNVLHNFGTSMDVLTDADEHSNAQVRAWIAANQGAKSRGIDIHFNNNNPLATGTEVIVSSKTTAENFRRAIWIGRNVANVLVIPLRQRVIGRDVVYPHETYVGSLPILEQTSVPMILLEVCFLNQRDLTKYIGKEDVVAHIIRHGMLLLDFTQEGSEEQVITLPLYQ